MDMLRSLDRLSYAQMTYCPSGIQARGLISTASDIAGTYTPRTKFVQHQVPERSRAIKVKPTVLHWIIIRPDYNEDNDRVRRRTEDLQEHQGLRAELAPLPRHPVPKFLPRLPMPIALRSQSLPRRA